MSSTTSRLPQLAASEQRFKPALAVVLMVALVLRLGEMAITHDEYTPRTDAADYDRHAVSIADGEGYPDALPIFGEGPSAFRPPAYPHALAGAYLLTGVPDDDETRWAVGRVFGALIGTATVALVALVALQLFGRRTAIVAGALAAVFPPFVQLSDSLLADGLFVPLTIAAIAAVLRYRAQPQLRWVLIAGVLAGAAALTRSNGIVLVLPLAIAVWPREARPRRQALVPVLTVVAATAAVIAPWTIRNVAAMDAFVPLTTQAGYGTAGLYNDSARDNDGHTALWAPPNFVPSLRDVFVLRGGAVAQPGLNELDVDRELRERAREYVVDHPSYLATVAFWNALRLFSLDGTEVQRDHARFAGMSPTLSDIGVYATWLLLPLAAAGLFVPAVRKTPRFLWLIPPLLAVSVIFTVGGIARYRAPIDPFLIWLAAVALLEAWDRFRRPSAA